MIFLTVGNRYGFDRLVRAVDDLVGDGTLADTVIAQIGEGDYEPRHVEFARYFDGDAYDARVRDAAALIGHAGSGTIGTAMRAGKPLVVMPRRVAFGEHVNDHQVATARTYAELGSVLCADSPDELPAQLATLATFVPRWRTPNVDGLVRRIGAFLDAS